MLCLDVSPSDAWAAACGLNSAIARDDLDVLIPALMALLGARDGLAFERAEAPAPVAAVRVRANGGGRSVIVRRYAPGACTEGIGSAERRWLRHAEAMAAACAAILPAHDAPVPALLGAIPERRLLILADSPGPSLQEAYRSADEPGRTARLIEAVEALEAAQSAGTAARADLRRALRRAGAELWRWNTATRGEELAWHAHRLLPALDRQPGPREWRAAEEGLLDLAAWAETMAASLCHGGLTPKQVRVTPAGVRLAGWETAIWGPPEYDLATLDCRLPLPPAAIDRYCERRGVRRRALFDDTLRRCRLIASIEHLARTVPGAATPASLRAHWHAEAEAARLHLLDDPLTRPLARALG